jgi:hypothetical protein
MEAPKVFFLDPKIYNPPRGRKIILMTKSGWVTIGHWSDLDCVAWFPSPLLSDDQKLQQTEANVIW